MSDKKITYITGTITLDDGTTSEFSISTDGAIQQWGATTSRLGETVDALDIMAQALMEDDLLASDEDDDFDDED